MNKAQLVDKVSAATGMTKVDVETVINETLDQVKRTVKKGDDVTLLGFGTFTKTRRKARNGHHPQTGTKMTIPAMTVPKFRPGADFKGILN